MDVVWQDDPLGKSPAADALTLSPLPAAEQPQVIGMIPTFQERVLSLVIFQLLTHILISTNFI